MIAMATPVAAQEAAPSLIEPDVEPQTISETLISSGDFEAGAFVGLMTIEDFESSLVWSGRLAYHLSESFFLEANVGVAEGGETSFEKLAGDVELLPGNDRKYLYYDFNLGFNILPGEAFVGSDYAFNSNFYLLAGAGATDFAGDLRFTGNYGVGYQMLLTDRLSLHLRVRQHLHRIDVTGTDKTVVNTEMGTGVSVFF